MSPPVLTTLRIAGSPEPWAALGFELDGAGFTAGTTRVDLGGPGEGITGWALTGVSGEPIDGLPTVAAAAPAAQRSAVHPCGALAIDHVVALTPSLERTIAAFEAEGIALRRVREDGPVRQAFLRVGEVVCELGQPAGMDAAEPARFWGLVFAVPDVDAAAAARPELIGAPKDAVQPGRRIATMRREAGIRVPAALITPNPRWRYGG